MEGRFAWMRQEREVAEAAAVEEATADTEEDAADMVGEEDMVEAEVGVVTREVRARGPATWCDFP